MSIMKVKFLCCVSLLVCGTNSLAQAQPEQSQNGAGPTGSDDSGKIADIIVTAQRRSERLQNVPIAVNVISADALAAKGIADTRTLMAAVPALQFNSSGPAGIPFLRGVGSNDANPNSEPSVATYVDGVYIASPSANVFSLNNVSRVEVLKGPQGTLFGRNATGGVIQIITRDPKPTLGLEASLGYANFDELFGAFYLTGGLAPNIAADLAIQFSNQGKGWGRDLTTGQKVLFNNSFSVRSKILFAPTSATTILLAGDYDQNFGDTAEFRIANGALALNGLPSPANGYDATGKVALDNLGRNRVNVQTGGVSLTIDHDLSSVHLRSISSYRRLHTFYVVDLDTTPLQIIDGAFPINQHNVSEELQLLSGTNSKISYVFGAYIYDSEAAYDHAQIAGAALGGTDVFDGDQRTRSLAGYGQATVPLFEDTKLTAGIRYTDEKERFRSAFDEAPLPTRYRSYSKPTWRLALDHAFSDEIHTYVSYNRGVKGGGFDILTPGSTGFEPEQLDAYEIGLKSELFDRHLRFNISAFRYDYKNIQVQTIGDGNVSTTNAASARIKGVDADFEIRPVSNLTINGGFAFLNGKYRSFTNATYYPASALDGGAQIVDASGKQTVNTPPFTGNLGANLTIPTQLGPFLASASISHNSGAFFAADNHFRQNSYDLMNASIGWTSSNGRLNANFFGRNLLNRYYLVQGVPSAVGDLAVPGAPRTYGVSVGVKF